MLCNLAGLPAAAPCKGPLHEALAPCDACKERLEANHTPRRHLKHQPLPVYTAHAARAFTTAAAAWLLLCCAAAAAAVCGRSEAMCDWRHLKQLALAACQGFYDSADLQQHRTRCITMSPLHKPCQQFKRQPQSNNSAAIAVLLSMWGQGLS
jgi:hypothetical protein